MTGHVVDDTMNFEMQIPVGWITKKIPSGYYLQNMLDAKERILLTKGSLIEFAEYDTSWNERHPNERRLSDVKYIGDSIQCAAFEFIQKNDTVMMYLGEVELNWKFVAVVSTVLSDKSIDGNCKEQVDFILKSLKYRPPHLSVREIEFTNYFTGTRIERLNPEYVHEKGSPWIDLCADGSYSKVPKRILGYYVQTDGSKIPSTTSLNSLLNGTHYGKLPPPPPPPTANRPKTSSSQKAPTGLTKKPEYEPLEITAVPGKTPKPASYYPSNSFEDEKGELFEKKIETDYGHWLIEETEKGVIKLVLFDFEGNWTAYNVRKDSTKLWLNEEPYLLYRNEGMKPPFDCEHK